MFRSRFASILATIAIAVGVGTVAGDAAIPGPNGYIKACYATSNGATRIVNSGAACNSGEQSIVWSQYGRGPVGIREYTATSTFVAPVGVSSVLVEAWGAGGGGGAPYPPADYCGSGGGAGAYARGVASVVPGQTYTIVVGARGVAGLESGGAHDGTSGGDSGIRTANGSWLVRAGAGGGGPGASAAGQPTVGGAGSTGDANGGILKLGSPGGPPGVDPVLHMCAAGYALSTYSGTIDFGTAGGYGGESDFVASPGGPGEVLLTW